MANNCTVTKLLHVSEQAAPPVQIPILVGNEVCLVTQQDVRRIEDMRHLTYSHMMPNNQNTPLLFQLGGQVVNGTPQVPQISTFNSLPYGQAATQTISTDVDRERPYHGNVASLSRQLSWSKQSKSCSYPLSNSIGTSTGGLHEKTLIATPRHGYLDKIQCGCQTSVESTSKACNTESGSKKTSQACNTDSILTSISRACNTESKGRVADNVHYDDLSGQ